MVPKDVKVARSHEWVRIDDDVAVIGISDHAQSELGDIVYVELPDVDGELSAGDVCGTIESVKAASDMYTPVSGTVIEVNEALDDAPETLNSSPYDEGWILKIQISDAAELEKMLDAEGYQAFLDE